jgi:hypothetical protein
MVRNSKALAAFPNLPPARRAERSLTVTPEGAGMPTRSTQRWRRDPSLRDLLGILFFILPWFGVPAIASTSPFIDARQGLTTDSAAPQTSELSAIANCSSIASLTSCVMDILAPGGGVQGVYLQQLGGPVLASDNETYVYEPASNIKPLVALYAMRQVVQGSAHLTDPVPMIDTSGGPNDCPPSSITGSEPLGTAIQEMLQVSDNNRTRELMQYLGVDNLNTFAASLGLSSTRFQTSTSPPGFNVVGCLSYPVVPLPTTIDGNTMSLTDVATIWSSIAALPAPYADALYQLAAGRDMYNSMGFDFTGVWPKMATIAVQEAPQGLPAAKLNSFINHMTVSVKGGSYSTVGCTPSCAEPTWWVFAGIAQIPSCSAGTVIHTDYAWGYFISDAVSAPTTDPAQTPAGIAFFNASGQLLSAPIAQALATWGQCPKTKRAILHMSGPTVSSGVNVDIGSTLANVTDTDTADIAPDLVGTIAWGDGSTSFATLSGGNGHFTVHGWHTYASPGTYKALIKIKDEGSKNLARLKVTLKVS